MTTLFSNKDRSKFKTYLFVLTIFLVVYGLRVLTFKLLDIFVGDIYNGIINWFFFLAVSILLIYLFGQGKWNLFKFNKLPTIDIFFISFILGLFALNNILFIQESDSFGYKSFLGMTILKLTISSIGEECMYRGFIQTFLNKTIGQNRLVFSNGNYFATALMTTTHLGFFTIMSTTFAFTSLLLVAIFSLTVGYFRDKFDSLIIPIVTHLLVNYLHFFYTDKLLMTRFIRWFLRSS